LGARAYIEAVQLVQLDTSKLTQQIAARLVRCNDLIARHASDREVEHFYSLLKTAQSKNNHFFQPLMAHFQQQLKQDDRLIFQVENGKAA
jgi:hypothetical protein